MSNSLVERREMEVSRKTGRSDLRETSARAGDEPPFLSLSLPLGF